MIQISDSVLQQAQAKKEEGNEHFKAKKYQEAIKCYSDAIEINPNDLVFYSNRAACHLALKNYKQTLEDSEMVLRRETHNVKVLRRKAIALEYLGRFEEAILSFKEAVQLTPSDGALLKEYSDAQQVQNSYNEAVKQISINDYQKALYLVQQIINVLPGVYAVQLLLIECLAKCGEGERAGKYLLQMQSEYGSTPDVYYLKGLIELYNGNSEKAKKVLLDGMKLDPDNLKCRETLKKAKLCEQLKDQGNKLLAENKFQEAIACYSDALLQDKYNKKMNAIILANRGLVKQKISQHDEAIADFTESFNLNPQYYKALLRRGDSYDKLGKFDESESDYMQAIQIEPSIEQEYGRKVKEAQRKSKLAKKKDYYKILEVARDASDNEIKKSYRRLALIWHPDKQKELDEEGKKQADQKFRDISEAYQVLSDKKKRDMFDQGIDPNEQGGGGFDQDPSHVFQMFFGGGGGFQQFQGFPGGGNLGIEYVIYSKDQIQEATESIQSLRLEQILVGECEPFDWNNILQRPELVECVDPSRLGMSKQEEEEEKVPHARHSLFVLKYDGHVRSTIRGILTNKLYHLFMLGVTVANLIAFCIYDQSSSSSQINRISVGIEICCNVAYGVEVVLKIINEGFLLEEFTYLRNKWNIVNFVTFISTWPIIFTYYGYHSTLLTVLRTVRLARVFRFILEIKPLKSQLDAYLGSFSKLGKIIVPLVFVIIYFSIVGLHLFMGVTEQRCRLTPKPEGTVWEADSSILRLCGIQECPENRYCGSPADYGLARNFAENNHEEFMWNFSRFDNLLTSLMVVFTFLNITAWSITNFMFWKAMTTYVTATFFLILMALLGFILSNLLLATFYESFMVQSSIKQSQNKAKQEQQQIEDEIQKKKQQQMMDRLAALSGKRKNETQYQGYNLTFNLHFDKVARVSDRVTIKFTNLSATIAKSVYFLIFNHIMIILCALAIFIDYDGISKDLLYKMAIIDFVCTIYSFIELSIYALGKGVKIYLKKAINRLDSLIILSQLGLYIVIYVTQLGYLQYDNQGLQLVKALKIVRLLKLFYSAKLFYQISVLTRCAFATILQLKHIIGLWFAFVLFVALVGSELLHDKAHEELIVNYSNFGNSLMAAFDIFYNEEWIITMCEYANVTYVSIAFYYAFIILGQVFFIRLYAAVFLNEFGKQLKLTEQAIKPIEYKNTAHQVIMTLKNIGSNKPLNPAPRMSVAPQQRQALPRMSQDQNFFKHDETEKLVRRGILRTLKIDKRLSKINVDVNNENEPFQPQSNAQFGENIEIDSENNEAKSQKKQTVIVDKVTVQFAQSKITKSTTFFFFDQSSTTRMNVIRFIQTTGFRVFSLFLVIITSIRINLANPLLDPNSGLAKDLNILNIVLTCFYSMQILLNTIAYGFVLHRTSFMRRSPFNLLNVIITILEFVQIFAESDHKIFNFFSSLRLLEFIDIGAQFNTDIKYAQEALMNALMKMIQLSLFCFIIFLIYGVFATKLLKGSSYQCLSIDTAIVESHVDTNIDCMDYGGSWVNQIMGYDDPLNSALTLFVTATTEGWLFLLKQTQNARGVNLQPVTYYNRWWGMYFQVFFFIGNLCMLNMFIGLVVNTYDAAKLKAQGLMELDDNQREWHHIKKSIYDLKPKTKSIAPKTTIRLIAFKLVKQQTFKKLWLIIIFLNTVTLSMYFHRQDTMFRRTLEIINTVLIIIQTFEICCRFYAKSLKMYCKDLPNVIDIFGIWICIAEVLLRSTLHENFYFQRCFAALSVAIQLTRNYRIIKRFNTLEKLFQSIFSVIPSALSMMYIMFIILFIFTNLGMDMFSYLRPQVTVNDFDMHFRKFTTAMFSLVKVASAEQWWLLMADCVRGRTPDFACTYIQTYDDYIEYGLNGCGTPYGYLFYLAFHLVFSLCILNLFIASILGAYEEHAKQEASAISKYQLNDVLSKWAEYDPEGTSFLNYKQFWKLSSEIALIFGVNQQDLLNPSNKLNFLKALDISLYENSEGLMGFLFHDVIMSLTRISVTLKYGVTNLEPPHDDTDSKASQHTQTGYRKHYKRTPYNSGHMAVIIYLQKKVRWLMNKKKGGGFLQIEDLKRALAEQERLEALNQ